MSWMRAVIIPFSRRHITIAANQTNNNTILPGRNEFLVGRKTCTHPSDRPFVRSLLVRWHSRVSLWRHLYAASNAALWLDGILSAGWVFPPPISPSLRPSPSCQTEVTPLRIRIRSQICGFTARSSRWVRLLRTVSVSLCEDGPSKLQPAGLVCSFGRKEFFVYRRVSLRRLSSDGTSKASTEVSQIKTSCTLCGASVGRQLSVRSAMKGITNRSSEYSRIVCVSPRRDAGSVRKEDVSDVAVKGRYRSYSQTWQESYVKIRPMYIDTICNL